MEQSRCSRCQGISFNDITGQGYIFCNDPEELRTVLARKEHDCDICSIVWWALRFDTHKIRSLEEASVSLYRNPPNGGPIQRIDVIVMPPSLGDNLSWAPEVDGVWRLGPPDEKPSIARGHLTLYRNHGWSQLHTEQWPLLRSLCRMLQKQCS